MTKNVVTLGLVCTILHSTLAFPMAVDRITRFQKMEVCKYEGEPPIVQIIKLTGSGGINMLAVSGTLNITRDIKPPIKYINHPTKCSITENECHTREPFIIPDICNFVFVPILSALSAFQPSISSCPFKKNIYQLKNVSFDTSLIGAQYKDNWRFQSKIRLTDGDGKLAFCLDFDWTMMVASRKIRKPKKSV